MYHVFLDNVTSQTIATADVGGIDRVELLASIYAGDAGRVNVRVSITVATVSVLALGNMDIAPYISVDAQVLYAARLFGNMLK